ncbi:MAG TPA: hypothetical protein VKQ11_01640 [Candidatus Sulfotelmatobacter sp.]|nr:hypothetical protein [Candidatus Sulfotelmatobacter sp.]
MGLEGTFHSQARPKDESNGFLYRSQPWYEAYMAALFEADPRQLEARIRSAEQLILFRERELVAAHADLSEQRALNNALHALHALHVCKKSRS